MINPVIYRGLLAAKNYTSARLGNSPYTHERLVSTGAGIGVMTHNTDQGTRENIFCIPS
jgi:hypothetical protein